MTENTHTTLWGELLTATEHGGVTVTDLVRRVGVRRSEVQVTLDEWHAHGRVALRPGGLYVVVVGWRVPPPRSGTFRLFVDDEAKTA